VLYLNSYDVNGESEFMMDDSCPSVECQEEDEEEGENVWFFLRP
jgi:hypothetical protein